MLFMDDFITNVSLNKSERKPDKNSHSIQPKMKKGKRREQKHTPGLARAPRAPLFVESALVDAGVAELCAAAAAAASVAKFCS